MICKECNAFFVRYPCPSCGHEKTSDILLTDSNSSRDQFTQTKSLEKVERLVRPSELRARTEKELKLRNEQDRLIKPSQLNPDTVIDPNDRLKEDDVESLVKPSSLHGGSSVNPRFSVTSPVKLKTQLPKEMPTIKVARRSGENDKEYKQRVRETLLEVMSLLEKLME